MKRIVICADGTWNRPEEDLKKDNPTNVLKFSRAITPVDSKGIEQVVFYDWGIGSYHDSFAGGAFGAGLNKNIQDDYRFIVHNYYPGDELYFFGFSRGAYTVRSLCGFINNCGIIKRQHARWISKAFDLYKDPSVKPNDAKSVNFRRIHAIREAVKVHFVGVWDTVGSLGVPISVFNFLNDRHVFHDQKIGPNIKTARHALAIDELRDDFEPTIWKNRPGVDLKQVWFAGVHSDVGGGYSPDKKRRRLSDIPMTWIKKQAEQVGLQFEPHISRAVLDPLAQQHEEYAGLFKVLGKYIRKIPKNGIIHQSVVDRYKKMSGYRPDALKKYLKKTGKKWLKIEP